MNIRFDEESHTYTYACDGEYINLTSVSNILSRFKQKFDKEFWLAKKAKERGITPEELDKEWQDKTNRALDRGTKYHKEREEKLLKEKGHPIKYDGDIKVGYDLDNLKKGWYPELIIYSLKHGICGTADRVLIEGDEFEIRDYKTNAKLVFEPFMKFDPDTKSRHPVTMKAPVQHLPDVNGYHYTLQLSIYAYMLEQFGYKCRRLVIDHIIFEEDEPVGIVEYPINYLKKEVKSILKHI